MVTACKHPRVRIVSRHEDTEYVECLECGDVFDSEEFNDMAIEESAEKEEMEADERLDLPKLHKSWSSGDESLSTAGFSLGWVRRIARCCGETAIQA